MMKISKWAGLMLLLLISTISSAQKNYPSPLSAPGSIVRAEYFFDADPGTGKGFPIAIAAATNITNQNVELNITSLPKGSHQLFLRTLDASGRWSLTARQTFLNFTIPNYGTSDPIENVTEAEYFFDTDPGAGRGTKVVLNGSKNIVNSEIIIDLAGLSQTSHVFYFRTKNAAGKWSLSAMKLFDHSGIIPYPTAPLAAGPLIAAEYFIDNDPGFGKGTQIGITSAGNIQNHAIDIPLNGLTAGIHHLYIRSKQNPWSLCSIVEFTFGSVLPLQWLYFKGEIKNDGALLQWGTTAQVNTASFNVQHSSDGVHFFAIGNVPSIQNTTDNHYAYTHKNVSAGFNYYRIQQVDIDGKFTYSKTIQLMLKSEKSGVVLAPNPVINEAYIIQGEEAFVRSYSITDAAGRIVKTEVINDLKQSAWPVDLSGLQKGFHTISIQYKDKREVIRFVKK